MPRIILRTTNRAAVDAGDSRDADTISTTAYVCTNDAYCPTADQFDTIGEFLAMCRECFGIAPKLRDMGSTVVDERGVVVLRCVSA
jgi:hypothetical protein